MSSRRTSALAFALSSIAVQSLESTASARLVVDHVIVDGESKATTRLLSARMDLYPGQPVDFTALATAERLLMESDLFTAARVYVDLPKDVAAQRMYVDAEDYKVDVHVAVTDKTSWFVVPTAGFGSGDYAGGVAYGDQNFLGHDQQIVAAAQLGQSRSFIFAGYRDPLVVGAPLTWELSGLYRVEKVRFFANHTKILDVPTTIGGGEVEVGWVLSPHLRALVGFSGRFQQVRPGVVLDPDATQPLYNSAEGRIFLLVFQIRYDDTVVPEGLRRGVRILLKDELSDQYWGSQFDYSKLEARAEIYGRIGWNYPSLLLGSIFDFPTSSRGVPLTEMLRVGGSNLRGYLVNEFHGDTLVSAQLEDQAVLLSGLPIPFVDTRFNIALGAFIDAAMLLERHPGGTALDLPGQPRPKLADVHTSVGAGFRFILPGVAIPALKADLGYGIDVRSFAVTVSIGGGG